MDVDSEGENDPRWLQTKTMMMIDDFTDVNEGEKELMKMWNLHVMKHGYVGDCQIPIACQMFLEKKGKELLMKNLYRNFVLHMSSLFDFGLISPVALYQILQKLQDIMKVGGEDSDVRRVLQKSHESQVEHWVKTGVHQMGDTGKLSGTSAKTNFNSEISNTNARRKTTLPIGSPSAPASVKNIHTNISKHVSMNSSKNNISNFNQNQGGGNSTTTAIVDDKSKSDAPTRRKSTNSLSQNGDSTAPLRRKSMANDNNTNLNSNNSEYHRRKLVLDVVPSGSVVNSKLSQNGDH